MQLSALNKTLQAPHGAHYLIWYSVGLVAKTFSFICDNCIIIAVPAYFRYHTRLPIGGWAGTGGRLVDLAHLPHAIYK